MSEIDELYLPKSNLDDYPVNRDFFHPLDALDIHKTKQTWVALILVESKHGNKIRLYKWRWNESANKWSVDLARMDINNWNMKHIALFLEKSMKF